jgi:Dolichyl-phosphate-mannose-protein mannosyltransferase
VSSAGQTSGASQSGWRASGTVGLGDPASIFEESVPGRLQRSRWVVVLDVAVLVGLAAVSAALRVGPLGPQSLWLDDAWIALAHKAESVRELSVVGLTAPGFAALFKGWIGLVGFSSVKAQLLPFLFGVAASPALYVVLVRRGVSRLAAATGAALIAFSTIHATYSTHVKQYTLEAFVAIVLIALFWWLIEEPDRPQRWWLAAGASIAAVSLASPSIGYVCAGFACALAVAKARERLSAAAVAASATAAAFIVVWWLVALRPRVNSELERFFRDESISLSGPRAALADLYDAVAAVATGAVPLPEGVALAVVMASFSVAIWTRTAKALVLLLPLLLAIALAALDRAPLGTGRTDIYLYPAVAAAVALALHELGSRSRALAACAATLIVAGLLIGLTPARPYHEENISSLVARVEEQSSPTDAVLVYHLSAFAFGLYTSWPIHFVDAPEYTTGWKVRVDRPNVHILDFHRSTPWRYDSALDGIHERYRVVWFISSHRAPDVGAIGRKLRKRGYRRTLSIQLTGAGLSRWVRGASVKRPRASD